MSPGPLRILHVYSLCARLAFSTYIFTYSPCQHHRLPPAFAHPPTHAPTLWPGKPERGITFAYSARGIEWRLTRKQYYIFNDLEALAFQVSE